MALFPISFSYDGRSIFRCINIIFLLFLYKDLTAYCLSAPNKGPCKARNPRFYFDHEDNKCKKFIYGGCKGNKNNYQTKDDCIETCVKGNLWFNYFSTKKGSG